VVEDGVSGFVVETVDQAVGIVARVASLDRANVRAAFENRFTIERTARDYLQMYHQLVESRVLTTRFRKANGERRREASRPKNMLAPRLPPSAAKRMGARAKLSAKVLDSSTKPVVESSEISVIPNAAAKTAGNGGIERRKTEPARVRTLDPSSTPRGMKSGLPK
jgi:hypothetical protein